MRVLEAASAMATLSSAFIILAVLAGKMERPSLVIAADLCFVTAIFQVFNFIIGYNLQKRLKHGREQVEDKSTLLGAGVERGRLKPSETNGLVRPLSVTEGTTAILEPLGGRAQFKAEERRQQVREDE